MYKLKLIKGLSYSGVVSASKGKPFVSVPSKETADKLFQSGYFELISSEEPKIDDKSAETQSPNSTQSEGSSAPTPEEVQIKEMLAGMNKSELISYAASIGADISECNNNGERRAAIEFAVENAEQQEADDGGATVDYS